MLLRLARLMGMEELAARDPREVRSIFLLLAMTAFLTADTMLLAPNVKLIMEEFGRSPADVGLVSSGFILFGAAIALIWGYLADRFPRKLLIVVTIVLGEIPCLATGYVQTYNQLLVVRALTGLGIGGMMPLVYSLIGDLVSERYRCTAVAWIGLADGLGYLMGMAVAANVPEAGWTILGSTGWRLPFVLVALPNFFIAPFFWVATKEPPRGAGECCLKTEIDRGGKYAHRIHLRDYLLILRNRTNLYFFLQSVPGTIGWGVLPYWLITYYAVDKGVSIPLATTISMLIGVGMMLGGFFGGLIGDRVHRRGRGLLPLLCGATTLVGLVLFLAMIHFPLPARPGFTDMLGPLAIGIAAGFFITVTSANVRAIELNVNPPENRGAMMSLFTLTDSIGRGVGPWLGGVLIGSIGYVWTMNFATFCWIPAALVFLFLMAPQYPRDAARMERLMKTRADEMRGRCDLEWEEAKMAAPRFDPLEP